MKDKKTSVAAIVGLIISILALLLSAVPIVNFVAFVLAVVSLVLGIVALVGVTKGKKSGKGLSIATIVISALAIGIFAVSGLLYSAAVKEASVEMSEMNESLDRIMGKKTAEILEKDLEVKIGKFKAVTGEYGIVTTSLPVEITNKLDESKTYTVQIEVVDKDGKRIHEDTVYATKLGAKQSQDFQAFRFIEKSKVEAIKKGTFKVANVTQS